MPGLALRNRASLLLEFLYRRNFLFNRFAVFFAFATVFFADFFAFSALFLTFFANFFTFRFAFLISGFAAATALFAVATAFPIVVPTVSPISVSVSCPGITGVSSVISSVITHLLYSAAIASTPAHHTPLRRLSAISSFFGQ